MASEHELELISAYVDGELTGEELAAANQLLASRPDLRDYADELRELGQGLAGLPRESLGADFAASVMERIAQATPDWPIRDGLARVPTRGRGIWIRVVVGVLATAAAVTLMVRLGDWTRTPIAQVDPLLGDGAPVDPSRPGDTTPGDIPGDKPPGDGTPGAVLPDHVPGVELVGVAPNMMMVIEVQLTPMGTEQDVFRSAMEMGGIEFQGTIPVTAKLEGQLLRNRYFGPNAAEAQGPAAPTQAPFELVYVVARGRQIDRVYQHLLAGRKQGEVSRLMPDFAIYPGDFDLFKELQLDSELALAQATPSDIPAADPEGAQPGLRVRAQRLAMSMAFQSKLGLGLRAVGGAASALLQGAVASPNSNDTVAPDASPSPPTGDDPLVALQLDKMERQTFGVLFLIRQ